MFEKKEHLRTVMGWGLCLLLPLLYSSLLHDALLNYGGEGERGKGNGEREEDAKWARKKRSSFFFASNERKSLSHPPSLIPGLAKMIAQKKRRRRSCYLS